MNVDRVIKEAQQRSIYEPDWFYRNVLKFPMLKWQVDASIAAMDVRKEPHLRQINLSGKPRITIRSCHGTGKTQYLAGLMHLWNFVTYGKIACTAPKEAQLTRRLWPRYRKAMSNADQVYKDLITVSAKDITVGNDPDWGAVVETASDPDNLAGYHDTPQLFVIDEASARRLDSMYPVIEGALTTPGSLSVEIGNPTRTEGEFYNHHMKKGVKDLYHRVHVKPEDAPELITQKWIDVMRVKYGEDSPIFKIRVLGEFAAYDDYTLVPPEYFEDSLDWIEVSDGSLPRLVVSIDVADGGADATVVTVCRHYDSFVQVIKQKAYWFETSKAPILAAKAGITMFEAFNGNPKKADVLIVDSLGVGAGTAGYLIEKKFPVINYKGSETQGINTKRFRNRRVHSAITCYEYFRDGKLRISPDAIDDEEELRIHTMSIKRPKNSLERIDDIEPKWKVKEDAGFSPDRFDSLSMQFTNKSPVPLSGTGTPVLIGSTGDYDSASLVR